MYKQHEPFIVAFDTQGATAGRGVQHQHLSSYSVVTMNTVIVHGERIVCFPHPGRKIQFRIVVRDVGHSGDTSRIRLTRTCYYVIVARI